MTNRFKLLSLVGAGLITCIAIYVYFSMSPMNLKTISIENYQVHCSDGFRTQSYMSVKDAKGNIYDSLGRIGNCQQLETLSGDAQIEYRPKNMTIYSFIAEGRTIISLEDSLSHTKGAKLSFLAFLIIVLFGIGRAVWLEAKRKD